jgi:hypothetical protein
MGPAVARFVNRREEGRYFVTMSAFRSFEAVKSQFALYVYKMCKTVV